jgi:hypothetical protein
MSKTDGCEIRRNSFRGAENFVRTNENFVRTNENFVRTNETNHFPEKIICTIWFWQLPETEPFIQTIS